MAKIQSSPDLPWTVRLFISAVSFAVDTSCRSNFTVNRRLWNLLDYKPSPLTKPHRNLKSSDVVTDPSRNLWFRLYTPTAATTKKLPILVFFHGGGFAFMSASSKLYDDFCQRLARELPAIVVSVNYRLSPEHRYPCQYDDGFDVLKFIDGSSSSCLFEGANLGQCFLAGDSAGGNIAHHVAIRASGHEFRHLKVVGMLAIQPFFGGRRADGIGDETEKYAAGEHGADRLDVEGVFAGGVGSGPPGGECVRAERRGYFGGRFSGDDCVCWGLGSVARFVRAVEV